MNDNWPDDFEVTLDEARPFIFEESLDSSDFGPLSLYFKHCILAHISLPP